MNKKCSLIISSCDVFQDTWKPFSILFNKYWSNCPYPTYLITNFLDFNQNKIKSFKVGEDKHWASNLKKVLDNIKSEYIIYLQDDYFLKEEIDNKGIENLINIAQKENVACLKLYPSPSPKNNYKNYKNIGEIKSGEKYRVSLQAAIWNTKILKQLLIDGESGWNMEIKGSGRSNSIKQPFLSIKKPVINYYFTGVVKGKWDYGVIPFLKNHNIEVDTKKRPVEPYRLYLKRKLRNIPVLKYLFIFIFKFTEKYKRIKNAKKA